MARSVESETPAGGDGAFGSVATDGPNRSFRFPALLTSTIALVAIGLGCGRADPAPVQAHKGTQPVVVGVANAERKDMPVYLTGLGSVTAFNSVNVKTRVDGQLTQVAFKEGQHVQKGDLLAVIDPRPYEVALSQAQAALFRDQAQLRDARLNYERFNDLLQQSGAMSQQQVDTQKATADQLEGTVRTDQAAIDNAKLNLTYCRITAPISGRVGLRLVDVGNMVHAADTNPLLVITQLQPISVLFTLPEDQLPAVAKRMRQNTLTVEAYSRDDTTKIDTGKLQTIDNTIDQTTGTGRLKAVFDNEGDTLWPNQFVNVHLLLEVRKNSIVVPAAAIQRGPQGTFVYGVKSDETVEVRPVTVSLTQGSTSLLASGLEPGETVVVDGQDKLQAGAHVQARGGQNPSHSPSSPAQPSATGEP
ncbi:MAG TPA: efflux RND transporter periplasmic adaptor subunit [Terriglobales bacterium]|jgi:multidrug efflux system membrane fusion protein